MPETETEATAGRVETILNPLQSWLASGSLIHLTEAIWVCKSDRALLSHSNKKNQNESTMDLGKRVNDCRRL